MPLSPESPPILTSRWQPHASDAYGKIAGPIAEFFGKSTKPTSRNEQFFSLNADQPSQKTATELPFAERLDRAGTYDLIREQRKKLRQTNGEIQGILEDNNLITPQDREMYEEEQKRIQLYMENSKTLKKRGLMTEQERAESFHHHKAKYHAPYEVTLDRLQTSGFFRLGVETQSRIHTLLEKRTDLRSNIDNALKDRHENIRIINELHHGELTLIQNPVPNHEQEHIGLYTAVLNKSAIGKQDWIVIVSGAGNADNSMAPFLVTLAKETYRPILYVTHPDGPDGSITQSFADATLANMQKGTPDFSLQTEVVKQAIEKQLPEDAKFFIGGHSLGGLVTYDLLTQADMQKRIRGAFLINPAGVSDSNKGKNTKVLGAREMLSSIATDGLGLLRGPLMLDKKTAPDPSLTDIPAVEYADQRDAVTATIMQRAASTRHIHIEKLPEDTPVTIIAGYDEATHCEEILQEGIPPAYNRHLKTTLIGPVAPKASSLIRGPDIQFTHNAINTHPTTIMRNLLRTVPYLMADSVDKIEAY